MARGPCELHVAVCSCLAAAGSLCGRTGSVLVPRPYQRRSSSCSSSIIVLLRPKMHAICSASGMQNCRQAELQLAVSTGSAQWQSGLPEHT